MFTRVANTEKNNFSLFIGLKKITHKIYNKSLLPQKIHNIHFTEYVRLKRNNVH